MRGEVAAAPIDRIRSHLVGLRMPRALETLDHVMQQLEHFHACWNHKGFRNGVDM